MKNVITIAFAVFLSVLATFGAHAQSYPGSPSPGQILGNYGTAAGQATPVPWMRSATSCPSGMTTYQLFANNNAAPTGTLLTMWDGTQCVTIGTLNQTAHTFTPNGAVGANPTAVAGPTAINGSSLNFMRADAAPAIQLATNAVKGVMEGDTTTISCTAGVCSAIGAAASSIGVGTTTIATGAAGGLLFEKSSGTFLGNSALASTPAMTINHNSNTSPSVPSGFGSDFLVGADNSEVGLTIAGFGGGSANSMINLGVAGGTGASPSATPSGIDLGDILVLGWTTAWNFSGSKIAPVSTQLWSSGAAGTAWDFYTTPNATQTGLRALRLDQDQSAKFNGVIENGSGAGPQLAFAAGFGGANYSNNGIDLIGNGSNGSVGIGVLGGGCSAATACDWRQIATQTSAGSNHGHINGWVTGNFPSGTFVVQESMESNGNFGLGTGNNTNNTLLSLASTGAIGWQNGTTTDAGLARNAAGVVEVNNGTPGSFRDLLARTVRGNAVVFASLPGSPVEGMMAAVTDSTTNTWGATITGSGTNHVLAYYDGTNWTVGAK